MVLGHVAIETVVSFVIPAQAGIQEPHLDTTIFGFPPSRK